MFRAGRLGAESLQLKATICSCRQPYIVLVKFHRRFQSVSQRS